MDIEMTNNPNGKIWAAKENPLIVQKQILPHVFPERLEPTVVINLVTDSL